MAQIKHGQISPHGVLPYEFLIHHSHIREEDLPVRPDLQEVQQRHERERDAHTGIHAGICRVEKQASEAGQEVLGAWLHGVD